MSLEEALKANTAALIAMTAALAAGAGTAAATTTGKPAKEVKAEPTVTSTHTRSEMNALLTEYKDKTSVEKVRELMGVKKMADVPDDQIDAVFKKATAALAKLAEEEDGV